MVEPAGHKMALLTIRGDKVTGHCRVMGSTPPNLLCRGKLFYVPAGPKSLRRVSLRERPLIAMLAATFTAKVPGGGADT